MYLNENKERRKILFSNCVINFRAKAAENPDTFLTWDGYPVDPNDPANQYVVGRCNEIADIPFYEFFCEQFVKFEMDQKKGLFGSKDKPIADFKAVDEAIKSYGYSTYKLD
jgi:hypothetical protein